MQSSASAALMETIGGEAGAAGVRTAINKMIVGFIPYHDHPYFGYAIMGFVGALVLWFSVWFWFNFIR